MQAACYLLSTERSSEGKSHSTWWGFFRQDACATAQSHHHHHWRWERGLQTTFNETTSHYLKGHASRSK